MRIGTILATATLSAGLATGGTAEARELRVAFGLAGDSPIIRGMQRFTDGLEEAMGGEHQGKLYLGSLLQLSESMGGLRDGVADISYVVAAYHRAEFPYANLVVDMATLTADPIVMTGASNEFMFTCAPCLREFNDQGQVFLGFFSAGPYYLSSVEKISEPADFQGKKVRGFGAFNRWLEDMGAVTVTTSANEVYESLSQGHLDGNVQPLDNLKSLSLGEVVDYVLDLPIGLNPGNAMFNANMNFWQGLTPEQQKDLLVLAGRSEGFTAAESYGVEQAYAETPGEAGFEFVEPSEALKSRMEEFRAAEAQAVGQLNAEQYGIADAVAQVERMQALIEKWEGLAEGIDPTDTEAVSKLMDDELFGKLDPAILTE